MLTFIELLEELSHKEVLLGAADVERMTRRFGRKTLQMGTINGDGSLSIPLECILEAVHSLGNQKLAEVVQALKSERLVTMLESVESLVERVGEARKSRTAELAAAVQNAATEAEAKEHWRKLEHLMFGI
jgi:hypothetical protein